MKAIQTSRHFPATVLHDMRGIAATRFALLTCLFAAAVALTVPKLLHEGATANPMIELRQHLPAALETIGDAMKG